MSVIDRQRLAALMAAEQARFAERHPRSRALFEAGRQHWLYGAPSHWMRRWIGGWPVYVDDQPRPYGVRVSDVDGNNFVDFPGSARNCSGASACRTGT